MSPRVKEKLKKSWAPVFYEHIFCKIDEKPFAVLYSDIGRPNFPVNISVSLEFIKHFLDYSDDDLINNYYFNYLINYAVGIRTLGELILVERRMYEFRDRIYKYTLEQYHPICFNPHIMRIQYLGKRVGKFKADMLLTFPILALKKTIIN